MPVYLYITHHQLIFFPLSFKCLDDEEADGAIVGFLFPFASRFSVITPMVSDVELPFAITSGLLFDESDGLTAEALVDIDFCGPRFIAFFQYRNWNLVLKNHKIYCTVHYNKKNIYNALTNRWILFGCIYIHWCIVWIFWGRIFIFVWF